jgi:hypothetical protein
MRKSDNQIKIDEHAIKREKVMIELMIGIIVGATFHEFWGQVFKYAKKKVAEWTSEQKSSPES